MDVAREDCDGGKQHPGKSESQFPQLPKTVFRILKIPLALMIVGLQQLRPPVSEVSVT